MGQLLNKFYCSVKKNPLDYVLSQLKYTHIYFCNTILILSSNLRLSIQNIILHSGLADYVLYLIIISLMPATCFAHPAVFMLYYLPCLEWKKNTKRIQKSQAPRFNPVITGLWIKDRCTE
jgi:hypothetical protein